MWAWAFLGRENDSGRCDGEEFLALLGCDEASRAETQGLWLRSRK